MSELLSTKLHVPRLRRTVVPRPRLSALLDGACDASLTVVSAPAGFGKTTLVTAWSTQLLAAGRPVAWVSLDARDNDPATFWAYVVGALSAACPQVQPAAAPPGPSTAALEHLLNDLQALPQDVVLVLDDYHVIDDRDVHASMAFLLDHLPPTTHVVLTTRADPPLQVARLRARGELVEVRAADLRFTPAEASTYLRDAMGLPLSEHDVDALDGRTEGWIAALQLAALSMQGREDLAEFIAGFTGDDRYIVDYLAEEVLQRLPPEVRDFLLHTSLLSRLTGALCDAVTGQSGGRERLDALDRENLFVVALDDQRRWYRYHHLFADVLRARLLAEQPHLVDELHLRASRWHASYGDVADAVHHATAGGHHAQAAELVTRAIPDLRRGRDEATLRRWLEALPPELVATTPVLGIALVGALMAQGETDRVGEHLRDVERWLEDAARTGNDISSDPQLRTLPATVAMYRAAQARLAGDTAGTVAHAQRVLDLVGQEDHLERGAAAALLGLAHWTSGDVEVAAHWYDDAVDRMRRAGHVSDLLGCTIAVADLAVARGRQDRALAAYEGGLAAARAEAVVPRGTADMHVGIASVLLERGDVDGALEHLRTSDALGPQAALPQNAYRWRLCMAQVRQADGDLRAALDLLTEAERTQDTDFSPDVRPLAAVRARLLLTAGRLDEVEAWVRARDLSADDAPDHLEEFEHLTLARLLLRRRHDGAAHPELEPLLERLLAAAEESGRTGTVVDVLVLQALAAQARGDQPRALECLRRALELGVPHGWVRTFLDHGPPITALLRALVKQPGGSAQATALLERRARPQEQAGQAYERLSDREIEVLRLLASDLDGPAIARTLVVSVNTVRTHTKSIYAKLGVTSRRAAVHRGQDLDLIPTQRRP